LTSRLERTVVSEKIIVDDLSRVEECATKSTYKLSVGFERCETSFNPKREVSKETPKPSEEAFVCIFCSHTSHLDEFCFHRKRIKMWHFDYARNSYRDEFSDFPPHSYSHTLPCTSSRALSHFSYGPNHRSHGLGSQENIFVPRRFGYGPHPYRGDHFLRGPGFSAGVSHSHFVPKHLDGPHFPCHGARPTGSNGKVQMTVKTSSGRMVKC
jgi:hypothetical protein